MQNFLKSTNIDFCYVSSIIMHTFNFVILETDGVPGQHFRPPLPVGPRPPQPQQQNFQQQQHQQLQQQQQQQQMENRTQMLLQQRQQMPGAIPNPARVEVSPYIVRNIDIHYEYSRARVKEAVVKLVQLETQICWREIWTPTSA